jgi:hypothetical protein
MHANEFSAILHQIVAGSFKDIGRDCPIGRKKKIRWGT